MPMEPLIFTLDKDALRSSIDLESLIKKYRRERSRKKMLPLYDEMIKSVAQRADPRLVFDLFGEEMVKQLGGNVAGETVQVVFGVCTLGAPLDTYYDQLATSDEMVRAAILDEIGVSWIVNLTRRFHQSVRSQLAERGLKAGPPYRPGVGHMPIELQRLVFDNLPTEQIGVALSDVLVMTPIRSTSLVIPVYARE